MKNLTEVKMGVEVTEAWIKFEWRDGDIVGMWQGFLAELPESIYVPCKAAQHGIKQKMADALAMRKEDKMEATVETAKAILDLLWAQLKEGNWNAPAKAGKAPAIKLTELEAKFMQLVPAQGYDVVAAMYLGITGKVLPKIDE